ncbi:FabD/lysophospholipase-like protein [Armillaria gallica]|uniref:FabD/lysophospholipase-like protein n=1 Tax=Armillaria gallica TaxID=47427 RepID=A0A2H3C858_ARMGA|nr:FabD/lysophospholipase-like protein [Armillaria gallica]
MQPFCRITIFLAAETRSVVLDGSEGGSTINFTSILSVGFAGLLAPRYPNSHLHTQSGTATPISSLYPLPESSTAINATSFFERNFAQNKCQAGHNNDQKLLDPDARPNSKGNAFVCSMPGINLRSPQCFRTYQGLPNQGPDCRIWEAARATTAAPTFFNTVRIAGPGGFGPDYVDAGLGFNNPTKEVRDEAKERPNRRIGVLVSIRTGHPGPSGFQQPKGVERVLPLELIRVLQRITTTDCESVADELAKEYGNGDTYFRFNFLHGAEGVSLDEWKKMSQVMAHTSSYLRGPEVSRDIDRVVTCLCSSLPQTK